MSIAGADRGGQGLLDQVDLAGARRKRRLLDRPPLDLGDPRGRADDHPRPREAVVHHLADELAEHRLGDLEVGDHAVAQRPVGGDRRRRAADHPLRVGADGVHLAGALVDRDHRRLGEHDPAPAHVDDRVGGAEIDGDVAARPQAADAPAPAGAAEQVQGHLAHHLSTRPGARRADTCQMRWLTRR